MSATQHRNYNKSGDIIDDNDTDDDGRDGDDDIDDDRRDDYHDLLYMLTVVAPPPQRSKDIAATWGRALQALLGINSEFHHVDW